MNDEFQMTKETRNPKHGAGQFGSMDGWINGLIGSTSIDPVIQQSTHPFIYSSDE